MHKHCVKAVFNCFICDTFMLLYRIKINKTKCSIYKSSHFTILTESSFSTVGGFRREVSVELLVNLVVLINVNRKVLYSQQLAVGTCSSRRTHTVLFLAKTVNFVLRVGSSDQLFDLLYSIFHNLQLILWIFRDTHHQSASLVVVGKLTIIGYQPFL